MEELCASQSIQWNVELDRGLRSNKPGANIEAIMKMGPRLQRWSEEPLVTALTANLFKLDSGQDRAFANAILLRLADAFRTGNNFSRFCVLRVFLLEFKKHRYHDKGHGYKCIISKERMPNHKEMVKRIKEVLSSGDVVARALSLRVLGCLVELVKDSAETHRIIIDAIESPYLLEVNAALFAAGSLCEVSKDFSSIILTKIIGMVNAMKTLPETKVAAVRLLGKMVHSPTLAHAAHEAGKNLMLRLPTDEIVTSTLLSMSKLAIGSIVTLPDQVDLLLSYAISDPRSIVRAMSLKCFRTLCGKATGSTSFYGKCFETLFTIVKDISLPTGLHCLAFQILSKLCDHYVTCAEAHQLIELVTITEMNCLHPDCTKRQAAVSLLVDLTCNIERLRKTLWAEVSTNLSRMAVLSEDSCRITDGYTNEISHIDLPLRVTFLVFDQISLAFKNPVKGGLRSERAKQSSLVVSKTLVSSSRGSHSFSHLLLQLIGECPAVFLTVIDCIKGMLEALVKKEVLGRSDPTEAAICGFQSSSRTDANDPECAKNIPERYLYDKQTSYNLKFMTSLCHCMLLCLDKLDIDTRIYGKVKKLTGYIAALDSSNHLLCYLIPALLKSCQSLHFGLSDEMKYDVIDALYDRNAKNELDLCVFHDDYWVKDERLSLEVANDMMNGSSIWRAYKIGIQIACHGAWLAASCIFQNLVKRAQSEACYFWLKSLALFSESENKLYAVLISLHGTGNLKDCPEIVSNERQDTDVFENTFSNSYFDVLSRFAEVMPEALNLNQTALNNLSAAVHLNRTFEFQRWYLNLRGKLMKSTAELLGLLIKHSHIMRTRINQEESDSIMDGMLFSYLKQNTQRIMSLKAMMLHVSSKFQRLANEFDIMNMSYMNIDFKSFQCISTFAFHCSLLSFCTLFVIHFPMMSIAEHRPNIGSNHVSTQSCLAVIQDLAQRLQHIDVTIWEKLLLFSKDIGDSNDCSMVGTPMSCSGYQQRAILRICRKAIFGILKLQEQGKKMKCEAELFEVCQNGLKFLGDVILHFFHLPLRIPKYFFQTSARIGIELYAANMDKRNSDGISVQQGFQLPLSLCVKVKNILPGSSFKVKRISCVISSHPSDGLDCGNSEYYTRWSSVMNVEEIQEVLDLTEELLVHMKLKSKSSGISRTNSSSMIFKSDNSEFMNLTFQKSDQKGKAFATFELDDRGQGFAFCLLDVSGLPCGSYETSWLGVCLDNRQKFWSLQPLNAGPIFSVRP